ncbi:MAG: YicC family protein [Clostridia bacterium]|nr:YicC family protein [Clostridia bacterium]
MVKSMTGYGRGEARGLGKEITVELRSVNHRFSEVVVRMPRQYSALEERVRKTVLEQVARGRVDVFVSVGETGERPKQVKVDLALARAYYNALKELEDSLSLPGIVDPARIVNFPDVLKTEEEEDDLEQFWSILEQAVRQAAGQLVAMRQVEGTKLKTDLLHRLKLIRELVKDIGDRAPQVVEEYRQKLQSRVQGMVPGVEIDEGRLAAEVVFFADRSAITEEIVRLNSHLEQAGNSLELNEPVGRKLDFLVQEMNREVNTIGSKSSDLKISAAVVEIKSEIEKIREQVQNIE